MKKIYCLMVSVILVASGICFADVWINEVDYDTVNTDSNEWIELAGNAGTSLNAYELVLINQGGSEYGTYDLAQANFTFMDESNGYGFFVMGIVSPGAGTADYLPDGWTINMIQNGSTDSIQLRLKAGSQNVHLLDYEGNNSSTTEDQVTDLTDSNSEIMSIYLTGPGNGFATFSWTNTASETTPGALNSGQTFGAASLNANFSADMTSGTAPLTVQFTDQTSGGTPPYIHEYTFGDGTTGSNASPQHVFTTAGVYTVSLYVIDQVVAADTETKVGYITVTDVPTGTVGMVWINELHYDNNSIDTNEGVEVAGPAGSDLSGYSLLAYNGNGGKQYASISLSGTIDSEADGFGARWFDFDGLQNGPDGIALVDSSSTVIQFLSYEGTFTATDDLANGMTSVNIGVEPTDLAVNQSLQLMGTGTNYSQFIWTTNTASRGSINSGQSFSGTPSLNANFSADVTSGTAPLTVQFTDQTSGGTPPYIHEYTFGDGTTGSNASPQHVFTTAGVYTVSLYVIDQVVAADTETKVNYITVTDAPTGTVGIVYLNEILVNPVGSDGNYEFIELKGSPSSALTGLSLLMVEGDSTGAGVIDNVVDLTSASLGVNGLLIMGENYSATTPFTVPVDTTRFDMSGGMENGSLSIMLVSNFTGAVNDDLDTNDDGTLDVMPWSGLLDSIGWTDGGSSDRIYSSADLSTAQFTPDAATRIPTNNSTHSAAAWYYGDLASTNALNPLGIIYDVAKVSSNAPMGATLTVGNTNYWSTNQVVTLDVTILTHDQSVSNTTASINVTGTSMNCLGMLMWSNILNGANGTLAVASNWTILSVPLAVGENNIWVSGTNDLGQVDRDSVAITRQSSITPTDLGVGDLSILGYRADSPDSFAFVTWVNINEGTEVIFTDHGWLASAAFRDTENELAWTAPAGGLSAGTVVVVTNGTSDMGSTSGSAPALSSSGDQIFVFQGSVNTPNLVFGIDFNGVAGWDSDATDASSSALPLALNITYGNLAVAHVDNGQYTGPRSGSSLSELKNMVMNTNMWTFENDGDTFGLLSSIDFSTIVDANTNGIDDAWEVSYFGGVTTNTAGGNNDTDDYLNWEEYVLDMNPTVAQPSGILNITNFVQGSGAAMDLYFGPPSTNSRIYDVWWSTNLISGAWTPMNLNVRGENDGSAVTLTVTNSEVLRYYRTGAKINP